MYRQTVGALVGISIQVALTYNRGFIIQKHLRMLLGKMGFADSILPTHIQRISNAHPTQMCVEIEKADSERVGFLLVRKRGNHEVIRQGV